MSGLLLLGVLVATACTRDGCEQGCALCGGGLWLCSRVADSLGEEQRQLEACGECPEGTICNFFYEPAECRPRRGKVGDRCGAWRHSSRPEHNFNCSAGLHCSYAVEPHVCAEAADIGMRCSIDAHCKAGLICSYDAVRVCVARTDAGPP